MGASLVCFWQEPSPPNALDGVFKVLNALRKGADTKPFRVSLRSYRLGLPSDSRSLCEVRHVSTSQPVAHVLVEAEAKISVATVQSGGFDVLMSRTLAPAQQAQDNNTQSTWKPFRTVQVEGWAFDHGDFIVRAGRLEGKATGSTSVVIEIESPAIPALPSDSPLLLDYARSLVPKNATLLPITVEASKWAEYGLSEPSAGWTPQHTAVLYATLARRQSLW